MKLILALTWSRKQVYSLFPTWRASAEEISFQQHKYYVATDSQKVDASSPKQRIVCSDGQRFIETRFPKKKKKSKKNPHKI